MSLQHIGRINTADAVNTQSALPVSSVKFLSQELSQSLGGTNNNSLRRKRFRKQRKDRCFARAKMGREQKKKRFRKQRIGVLPARKWDESKKMRGLGALSLFWFSPIFRAGKTSKIPFGSPTPRKRLLRRLKQ